MIFNKFCGIKADHGPHEHWSFMGGNERIWKCLGFPRRFDPPVGEPIIYRDNKRGIWMVNTISGQVIPHYWEDLALNTGCKVARGEL